MKNTKNEPRWSRNYYNHFPGFGTVAPTKSHSMARSSWWHLRPLLFLFGIFVCFILLGSVKNMLTLFNMGYLRRFKYIQPKPVEYPTLYCTPKNVTHTCPSTTVVPPSPNVRRLVEGSSCPEYFRWIHEDLRPWKETGITREMLEKGRRNAQMRVVIIQGKVYVEKYRKSIQTRDKFTVWGIVQLLRWYPSRVPDLELFFDTEDRPIVRSKDYRGPNSGPPPLFRYCSDPMSLDIVFPDWSFWGWVETNIKPWRQASKAIAEGNKKTKWEDRSGYAYWRGNPKVSPIRRDLMKCNSADWNTNLYIQDWILQQRQGYKNSNLENQCNHKYKIYVEGYAWSVSEKYIFACDAMTLVVSPHYYEFFARGMLPLQHYWPIRENDKCRSLKFAVEWGNNHTKKAREIGEYGSRYILDNVKMELVYDYMYHMLNEYARLLRFKPKVPQGAVEVCPDTMVCQEEEPWRRFMKESLEMSSANGDVVPCKLPPPYHLTQLKIFLDKKANLTRQVEVWEDEYWKSSKKG